MDRRQRKTRDAIFTAFTALLSAKDYHRITVAEILDRADIGRATFYAHFETKEHLLKELCEELCCHLLDAVSDHAPAHHHIFRCDAHDSVFLHLFEHLEKNDHNLLRLLSGHNADLFTPYFKNSLRALVTAQLPLFDKRRHPSLPEEYWIGHITSTLLETVLWWIQNGLQEPAATITEYFLLAV